MKIKNPEKRLQKFWGKVDQKHIASFVPFIEGKTVLDLGCGNGSTTAYITKNCPQFDCIGVDYEEKEVEKAKELFSDCNYMQGNAENLKYNDNHFDTIILRDALHHLFEESDFEKVKKELARLSHDKTVLIIFDPNINFILKFARFLAAHKDAECNYESALDIAKRLDFTVNYIDFNTLYSLPLSGGYVGINFVPNVKFVQSFILASERFFEKVINRLRLGRYFCWRYLIVAKKSNPTHQSN